LEWKELEGYISKDSARVIQEKPKSERRVKMARKELDDLSGPFDPDLTFADLSKGFLLKIMEVWQFAWIHMAQAFYTATRERFGIDAANEIQLEAWEKIGATVNPRYAKIGNIQLNTVVDSLKALQLPLDNTMGNLYRTQHNIINENHVIITVPQCRSLLYYEKNDPEMINWFCHVLEKKAMEKYLINPKIKVTPLKLAPRKSPDEPSCVWEFKMEE